MMKFRKSLTLLLIVLCGFILMACQSESEIEIELVGEWQVVEHNGEEVKEFNPYYHHYLHFEEDNTFKMQSFYFHPDQDFDYKRGWFPRISDRELKLMFKENLVGTYTYEDNIITLYDRNQEPFKVDMIYEVVGTQIERVTTTDYAKFVYEKIDYVSIKDDLQGDWLLDQMSTNTLSGDYIEANGVVRAKISNEYISFYSQFASFPNFTVKIYPGQHLFQILEPIEGSDYMIGYLKANVLHIIINDDLHLVYKKTATF